jgi:biopolymer transport protein ExbD
MKRSSAGVQEQSVELNFTPMIDCVFQLIIFFVVTMRYPQIERNLPAFLPKTTGTGRAAAQAAAQEDDVTRYLIRLEYDESQDPGVKRRLTTAVADYRQAQEAAERAATVSEKERWREQADQLLSAIPKPIVLAQGAVVRSFSALDGQLMLLSRTKEAGSRLQIVLDAEREVPFMFVIRVQEICSIRGFNEISFAAKGEK